MNREIFYNKNTVKKIPKFLSCLSIVKEVCQEIQSFLSISQNRDTFRKQDTLVPKTAVYG